MRTEVDPDSLLSRPCPHPDTPRLQTSGGGGDPATWLPALPQAWPMAACFILLLHRHESENAHKALITLEGGKRRGAALLWGFLSCRHSPGFVPWDFLVPLLD